MFIITYGRSGSTLLLGMLNSIPGYHILGENNDSFKHIYAFINDTFKACLNNKHCEQEYNLIGSRNPWYNDINVEQIFHAARIFMENIIDPNDQYTTIGFKEIRYPDHMDTDLSAYLDALHMITNCKFIYLTRDLDLVVKSKWFAKNPEENRRKLTVFQDEMEKHINARKERQMWYHLTMDQMIHNDLQGLFDYLGENYHRETIAEILKIKHSY